MLACESRCSDGTSLAFIERTYRCSEQSRRKAVTQSHGTTARFAPGPPGRQRVEIPDPASIQPPASSLGSICGAVL